MGEHNRYKAGGLGTGNVGGHDKSQARGIRDWKCGRTLGSIVRCNDIAEWGVRLWRAMGIDRLTWMVELMWISSGDGKRR